MPTKKTTSKAAKNKKASKAVPAKKNAVKKVVAKKPKAKKPVAKKVAAKISAKKIAKKPAKKVVKKKIAAKKAPAKKAAPKKSPVKKVVAKKPKAKKPVAKKPVAKKPVAKKPVAKKVAAKEVTPKKVTLKEVEKEVVVKKIPTVKKDLPKKSNKTIIENTAEQTVVAPKVINKKQDELEFAVDDFVIYPSHGIGKIIKVETLTIMNSDFSCYLIYFEREKLTIKVPIQNARNVNLRHIVGKSTIEEVFAILRSGVKKMKGMWSRRAQEYEVKINSGDIFSLAEVLRDLARDIEDGDRSYSERIIYETAIIRLAAEYAVIYNITLEKAKNIVINTSKDKLEDESGEEEVFPLKKSKKHLDDYEEDEDDEEDHGSEEGAEEDDYDDFDNDD